MVGNYELFVTVRVERERHIVIYIIFLLFLDGVADQDSNIEILIKFESPDGTVNFKNKIYSGSRYDPPPFFLILNKFSFFF